VDVTIMKKIDEEANRKLAISIVDTIEENMNVGGIAAVGPAQGGGAFAGSLSNIGGIGSGATMPNGVGNAPGKGDKGEAKGTTSANSGSQKNEYGKLPKHAEIQVMALVNKVNGPLGRKSGAEGVSNIKSTTTTVSGVKATIDQIGSSKK
jgi:hypothetical protein